MSTWGIIGRKELPTQGRNATSSRSRIRQVFTDFTVFASQYAYYVRACDRCRLVNSAWVETTAGVYDEAGD